MKEEDIIYKDLSYRIIGAVYEVFNNAHVKFAIKEKSSEDILLILL